MCQIAKISKSSYYNWLNKKYSEQELEIMEMVKQLIGLKEDIKDRTVVIIEDIIDSGLTMEHLLQIQQ